MRLKLNLWIAEFHFWRWSRKLRRLVKENDQLREAAGLPLRDWSDLSTSTQRVLGRGPIPSRLATEKGIVDHDRMGQLNLAL